MFACHGHLIIDILSDADWVGLKGDRKSTIGAEARSSLEVKGPFCIVSFLFLSF